MSLIEKIPLLNDAALKNLLDNARRLANVAETELTDRVAQLADASARLRDAEVAVAAAAAAHATAEKRRRDALALLNTLTDEAPALDA